jgi:hypothetical protein
MHPTCGVRVCARARDAASVQPDGIARISHEASVINAAPERLPVVEQRLCVLAECRVAQAEV